MNGIGANVAWAKLIKIGTRSVRYERCVTFQPAKAIILSVVACGTRVRQTPATEGAIWKRRLSQDGAERDAERGCRGNSRDHGGSDGSRSTARISD